ncbi:hypothetical protein V8C37DRAFT_385957, partial [Trichoderma ceciliae]
MPLCISLHLYISLYLHLSASLCISLSLHLPGKLGLILTIRTREPLATKRLRACGTNQACLIRISGTPKLDSPPVVCPTSTYIMISYMHMRAAHASNTCPSALLRSTTQRLENHGRSRQMSTSYSPSSTSMCLCLYSYLSMLRTRTCIASRPKKKKKKQVTYQLARSPSSITCTCWPGRVAPLLGRL